MYSARQQIRICKRLRKTSFDIFRLNVLLNVNGLPIKVVNKLSLIPLFSFWCTLYIVDYRGTRTLCVFDRIKRGTNQLQLHRLLFRPWQRRPAPNRHDSS